MNENTSWDDLLDSMLNYKREWEIFLVGWCDGKYKFIKDFGFPFRRKCFDVKQLYNQVLFFSARMHNDVYTTVYNFDKMRDVQSGNPKRRNIPDYSTANVNKVFIDLDLDHAKDGNLDMVLEDAFRLYDYFDGRVRMYYTGGRGVHCFIDVSPCLTKAELRCYTLFLVNGLNIRTADRGIIGDVARISRLPYTVHSKTKQFMVPINRDMSSKDVISLSRNCLVPKHIEKRVKYLDSETLSKVASYDYKRNTTKVAVEKKESSDGGNLQGTVVKEDNAE